MRIEATQTYNPTPNRGWDWQAIYPDMEDSSPVGHGETVEEAIALLKLCGEME